MELKNLMEGQVLHVLDRILKDRNDVCKCDKCRLDIAAIALNNLKPKYVVTEKGRVYAKLAALNYQNEANIIVEITKAIKIVGENPRHD
ncbi:MAG: late competence development ComFB family protein [Tissierellia bacterium]|mgnify:FL=1|nr:late competence development ComFB family protein [Tissierellia bacterium]